MNLLKFFSWLILVSFILFIKFTMPFSIKETLSPSYTFILADKALKEFNRTLAIFFWLKLIKYHSEEELIAYTLPAIEVKEEDWRQDKDILPLLYIITELDPHFVEAYDLGGYQLAINLKKINEGITFLQRGIERNPQSFALNFRLGFVYFHYKMYAKAIPYFLKAVELTKDNLELFNTLKLIGFSYWRLNRLDKAYYYFKQAIQIYPQDKKTRNFIDKLRKDMIKK